MVAFWDMQTAVLEGPQPMILRRQRGVASWLLAVALAAFLVLAVPAAAGAPPATLQFTDISAAAGIDYLHGFSQGPDTGIRGVAAGVAVGDYDEDGWLDIFMARGDSGPDLLLHNLGTDAGGQVRFEEVGAAAGVVISGRKSAGPFFADLDGDGLLDLFVGGVEGTRPAVFLNRGGAFVDFTAESGIVSARNTVFGAFGDPDRDGDLDLYLAHWAIGPSTADGHLWRNRGDARFDLIPDAVAGTTGYEIRDVSFTPNFADLDGDGWQDLAIAEDGGTSKLFRNRGDGSFERLLATPLTDENGMGAALADFDRDGDLDWFVSSIWDPGVPGGLWGTTGNRLYRNRGDATFEDATDQAGVRAGYWGWGSCFGDFDHDGDLDLFHVNGFYGAQATLFHDDPARFFLAAGDGSFSEQAAGLGVADRGQGRGAACADFDRDGDLDILISQSHGQLTLYRNDGSGLGNYLALELRMPGSPTPGGNPRAIGAQVIVEVAGRVQTLRLEGLATFQAQQPEEIDIGLGTATRVDRLEIRWPDGSVDVLRDVAANRRLRLSPGAGAAQVPVLGPSGLALLALLLALVGAATLARRG